MTNFKKQNKIAAVFCFLFLGLVFLPSVAKASRIYFSPVVKEIYKDDVFILEVRISSSDQLINATEGVLLFNKNKLEVKELSAGGSLFDVWLQKPAFSNQDGKINFTAGTPDGFQGENALVLKIIFLAKNTGEAKLDFQDATSFFLHDGKGTPINPWLKSLTLNILERTIEAGAKDEWQLLIEKDKTLPEPFKIVLGQEPSVFDNQYFISFFTTDKESGIAYYEVKEGKKDSIKAESPYLLKDQSLQSLIKVKAVDKAGNERIVEYMPPQKPIPWRIIIGIIIGLAIIILIVRKFLISNKMPSNN